MQLQQRLVRTVIAFACVFFISACGGGGGGGGSSSTSSPGLGSATVVLDPALPTKVSASIAQVVSPQGSGSLNASLPISLAGPTGEALVLALTGSGDILLAALPTSANVTLGADTTALALARIYVGALPAGLTASQLNAAIKTTAGFTSLVNSIAAAVSSGTPPAQDAAVQAALSTVLSQAAPNLASFAATLPVAATAHRPTKIKAGLAAPTATAPLPFTLIADTGLLGYLPVGLSGNCLGYVLTLSCKGNYTASYDLAVANNMPITWSYMTSDPISGATLGAYQLLPSSQSSLTALFKAITTWNLVAHWGAKANNAQGLNLTLAQTPNSQTDNVIELVSDIISFGLEFAPTSCSSSVIKTEIAAPVAGLISASRGPTGLASAASLRGMLQNLVSPANIAKYVGACAPGTSLAQALGPVVKALAPSALGQVVSKVNSAAVLSVKIIYLLTYFDAVPVTTGICVDKAGLVQSCDASFTFAPAAVGWVQPGVAIDSLTSIQALDAQGKPTGTPSGLTWSQNDGGTVVTLNAITGSVIAKAAGTATITVSDPLTGASGAYLAEVVDPAVCPSTASLQVGVNASQKFSLLDTTTTNCGSAFAVPVIAAPNTLWYLCDSGAVCDPSVPSTIASLTLTLFTACSVPNSCAVVTGLAAGTTTLHVKNGVTGTETTSSITVTAATPPPPTTATNTYYFIYQSYPCGTSGSMSAVITGGGQTLTLGSNFAGGACATPANPNLPGFDSFEDGPHNVTLQTGTTYTLTVSWDTVQAVPNALANSFELDGPTGSVIAGRASGFNSPGNFQGQSTVTFTTAP